MLITPRDYQITAHNALWSYFEHKTGNPIVAQPTGVGKSVQIAMFCYEVLMRWPSQRIMVSTHVQELIEQDAAAILEAWPEAPVGIYSAGLGKRELDMSITVAGIASLANVLDNIPKQDLLIIDECHLLSPNAEGRYMQLIEALKAKNPWLKVIGLSATPWRPGLGLLTAGPIFTDFAVDMTTMEWYNWFIGMGYMCKPIARPGTSMFDLSGVSMSGGDFNGRELIEALNHQDKVHLDACKELVQRGQDRKSWLVFTAGIERAEFVASILTSMGIPTSFVHSKLTDRNARRDRIEAFRAGEYRCMVGNNVFTTGFNHKAIDLIGMMRPTASAGLWVQMIGRGTRPVYAPGYDLSDYNGRFAAMNASGKTDVLVLDFAGNTERLGPVNDPVLPHKKGKSTGEMPTKICALCGVYNHLAARVCDNCGAEFEFQTKVEGRSYRGSIVRSEDPVYEWFHVSSVIYSVHQKFNHKPCVKVTYQCGFRSFLQWLFPEGDRYNGSLARAFWNTRVADEYKEFGPPPTSDEFVMWSQVLKKPKKIKVHMNAHAGKHPEVTSFEYE